MFFTYAQNNSGGYFIEDEKAGVCEYVIVEADSAEQANDKLKKIGSMVDSFYDYCPCCGERWQMDYMDDDDSNDVPSIYGKPITTTEKSSYRNHCFVHYEDGRIEEVVLLTQ